MSVGDGRDRFTHRPGSVRNAAALSFAVVTTVLAGGVSPVALAACALGVVGLAVGLTRGDRRTAGIGSVLLLGGAFAAGALGAPPARLLPAVAAAIVAWDLGMAGFAARRELGEGRLERAELLHVGAVTAVGAAATGVTLAFYRTVSVGASLPAVFLLLVAATALGLALRD